MTPFRFRECLKRLRWQQGGLAQVLNINPMQARRWGDGRDGIPPDVAEWLERLVAFHEQNPPPEVTRTKLNPLRGNIKI